MTDLQERAKTQQYVNYLMDVSDQWFEVMELGKGHNEMGEEWQQRDGLGVVGSQQEDQTGFPTSEVPSRACPAKRDQTPATDDKRPCVAQNAQGSRGFHTYMRARACAGIIQGTVDRVVPPTGSALLTDI